MVTAKNSPINYMSAPFGACESGQRDALEGVLALAEAESMRAATGTSNRTPSAPTPHAARPDRWTATRDQLGEVVAEPQGSRSGNRAGKLGPSAG